MSIIDRYLELIEKEDLTALENAEKIEIESFSERILNQRLKGK